MSTFLLLVGVVVLIGLNGFFVAAEFALVRVRRNKLEELVDQGARGARVALRQLDSIDEYLAACQAGITVASIGIGFLGEPAIATQLEPLLGEVVGEGLAIAIALGLALLITTSLHITTGEQVPKIFAITHPEAVARRIARPLDLFTAAFRPLVSALNATSNWMLRMVGIDASRGFEEDPSNANDLRLLIAQGEAGGRLDPGEAGMLEGVFHLHEQEARQVMTPIPAVVTVDAADTVADALERCVESGHTRLVVTENGSTDEVLGIVHNNSLVRMLMSEGAQTSIRERVKPPVIVPETKPLDDLLADLQRERSAMAIVVDEYGRTAGIVTVEDIIEEIVGEITDETDHSAGVRQLANGDWFVRGHVPINDLVDYSIDLDIDNDAFNSVGGFVFAELGRLPKRGDMVRRRGYSLRVESVRQNRIEAVRIRDHEPDREERGARSRSSSRTDHEAVRDEG
ncbi:MAG: HlyC/CorC family transporter [Thermoleophilaceae bacterium]|nr:HlyC/CorC family transporter [Thermoleophilaceae bacterium]